MKNVVLVLALLIVAFAKAQTVQEVEDFHRIMIDTDAQVEVIYSPKSQVMMNLSEDQLSDLKVDVKNGALVIKQLNDKKINDLRIRIYTNRVSALAVKGDTEVSLSRFKFQNDLVVQTSDNSSVDLGELKVENLNIMRTKNSSVVCKEAKNTKETVDGVAVAS